MAEATRKGQAPNGRKRCKDPKLWYALAVKPHPRIRKTVKWGGAAVTVLLVVVWIGSGRLAVRWISIDHDIWGVINGTAFYLPGGEGPVQGGPGLDCCWMPEFRMWWNFKARGPEGGLLVSIPLWSMTLVCLAATSAAWRLDTLARRRARPTPHLYPKCNYDRTGLRGGAVCPECGSAGVPS